MGEELDMSLYQHLRVSRTLVVAKTTPQLGDALSGGQCTRCRASVLTSADRILLRVWMSKAGGHGCPFDMRGTKRATAITRIVQSLFFSSRMGVRGGGEKIPPTTTTIIIIISIIMRAPK